VRKLIPTLLSIALIFGLSISLAGSVGCSKSNNAKTSDTKSGSETTPKKSGSGT